MKNIFSKEQELLTIIVELQAKNAKLQTENTEMQKRLVELETKLAKLSKNSSISSKPPSSDIVKPPKTSKANSEGKRKKEVENGLQTEKVLFTHLIKGSIKRKSITLTSGMLM